MAMTQRQALDVIGRHRGSYCHLHHDGRRDLAAIVRPATRFRLHALGHGPGPALGLGLALAHTERGVIVLNGDGSMLMNLGSFVTLANHPANIYLAILDNSLYEVRRSADGRRRVIPISRSGAGIGNKADLRVRRA